VETLPEEEEGDEDKAVVEINFAIGAEDPGRAGEKKDGDER